MKKSRREFLKESAITVTEVAGASLGLTALLESCSNPDKGKKVKLLSPDGKLVEVNEADMMETVPESSHNVRTAIPGKKFVMVFDLSKCKGAGKCMSACSKMHYLPPQRSYIKVTKMQDAKLSSPYWMPNLCFHCDNPPCVKVCPVGATFKLEDGIVAIDNERCIGCRFCMVACPYSERTFNWGEDEYELTSKEFKKIHPHEICSSHIKGTVEKCDFCPHNAEKGILPACVTGCPYGAIYFGNEIDDSVSNGDETVILSEFLKNKSGYRFLEEFGTQPRVYYLPPVNREFPFEDRILDRSDYW